MSRDERPLPEPPSRPFGRTRKKGGEGDEGPLLADRLAAAAAEGRLEEFVAREFPDNERARSLAMTMMSLTGMAPGGASVGSPPTPPGKGGAEPDAEGGEVPAEVHGATARGDVRELVALLAREHRKGSAETAQSSRHAQSDQSNEPPSESKGDIEKETLDSLLLIASKEGVSLDWLIGRALALYVRDYDLTGRL